MEYIIIGVMLALLHCGALCGVLANKLIRDKGYRENWFWWGFFFGPIAVAIACMKPAAKRASAARSWKADQNRVRQRLLNEKLLEEGGWACSCGRVNAHYVTTCPCGINQRAVAAEQNKSLENGSPRHR